MSATEQDIIMFKLGFKTKFCEICDNKFYTGLESREICGDCISKGRSQAAGL